MECQGCNREVIKLSQSEANQIRKLESSDIGIPAFECRTCQIIIFEDELTEGRFVPPEYRLLVTRRDSGQFDNDETPKTEING